MAVPARYIRTAGGKVLDVLDRAGLRGLATGTVAAVLAELYVDLRVLRPFQVGNDEAIRVFLSELADDAGYRIDWPAVPPAALTAAGDTGDPDPLRAVLQGAVQHTGRLRHRDGRRPETPRGPCPGRYAPRGCRPAPPADRPRPARLSRGASTPLRSSAATTMSRTPTGPMPIDTHAGQRRLMSAAVPVLPCRTGVTRSRSRAESSTRIGTNSRVG